MATYTEIRNLFNDSDVKNRVVVAVAVSAQTLAAGTPTAADNAWISSVLSSPQTEGSKAFIAVLAANKAATVAQIQGATDVELQTKVDEIVPTLIAAMAGV